MSEEEDYKKSADFAIREMQRLIDTLENGLENWSNSQYSDTDIGKDICATLQEQIKEAKEEIKAYEQYKATGVYITRKARKVLQESSRENKQRNNEEGEER